MEIRFELRNVSCDPIDSQSTKSRELNIEILFFSRFAGCASLLVCFDGRSIRTDVFCIKRHL